MESKKYKGRQWEGKGVGNLEDNNYNIAKMISIINSHMSDKFKMKHLPAFKGLVQGFTTTKNIEITPDYMTKTSNLIAYLKSQGIDKDDIDDIDDIDKQFRF